MLLRTVATAAGLPVLCDTVQGALFPAIIVKRAQCILYTNSTLVLGPV
jgi:alanine-alpha-ketoisovalerate/valine-pyruvate aminotransferase